ncbi:FxLYD domain-containing protein [Streptomyces uncialis]|uniref:FxLYD domain-containing protein n=1 Tax=Streptomyces uncialis TaxID=1048205 RepID=UPI00380DA209|nr:FxLYD domain-containing protein [Streptomyces uncialis]
MNGYWKRTAAGAALLTGLTVTLTGCSDDGGTPASTVSNAASAVASVGASLASSAADSVSAAAADAQKKLDDITDGVDARDEVTLSGRAADDGGRATVPFTVRNTADSAKSFGVQVNFKDADGNLVDTVVVSVKDVAAGATKDATARGTHQVSGEVTAEVATAVRY